MHLKTINRLGNIVLKDYSEKECDDIFIERNSYVLRKEHNYGDDYGGSHHSENSEVTYEEIIPEYVLVKNKHFYGVCISREYNYANGGFKKYLDEACLLIDGTGSRYVRTGTDFSNDDHSRWDYVDCYLVERDEMESK